MATTNIQSFAGDVEVSGELTVTGQLNSVTGSDKMKLTATTSNETDYIPVAKSTTGAHALYTDSNLTYNPANNQIAANLSGNVTGNVSGNAAFATNATYATSATHANAANAVKFTDRDATDDTDYIAFVDGHGSGDKALFTDQNLTYNSSSNQITANLSGNVTGNVSGNAAYANSAGSATNATFATSATHSNAANAVKFTARNANNTTDYLAFVDSATAGDKALFTDSNLTDNASTNQIAANLSGNVTGNVSGSAGSATNATFATNATHANKANAVKFTARDATDATDYIAFVDTATAGDKALYTDSNLTYNPANNQIAANLSGNVTGNVSGNAAFATNATYATSATHANAANAVKFTDRDATDDTDYIAFVDGHGSGDKALFTDQNLTYNSSSNQITANLSGNVTGNVSGNAAYANSAGFATNATFATSATHSNAANAVKFTARNANNTTDYLAFVDTATAGDKALFTDSNLTYNSSTNQIAANLSGNVTGNVSGSAGSATNATYANSAGSATNATYANSAGSATNATFATNATHANKANAVAFTARDANNDTDYMAFVDSATAGDKALFTDTNLTYNSSTNQITANLSGNVTGNVSGNAAFATSATHANKANTVAFTDRDATDDTDYIAFVDGHGSGDKALFTDQNLTYNSSTNQITANLSGNVTGNVSGNAAYANSAGSATNATFATSSTHSNAANAVKFTARNASNNTDYIAFVDTATAGDKSLFTDQNLTYNSSTNHINANVPYATNAGYANSAGSATNATFANNATNLGGRGLSEGANASSIVARNASGDIYCRLLRPSYTNQNTISGAMAYRVNNGNDNYVRFCSNTGSIRGYLNVPTRTGGDASGTWSINVNGNAAYANSAGSATNAAYANNAGLLGGAAKSTGANANSIAQRDGNGDLFMRYGQAQYLNMSHGAADRNTDTVFYSSTDNYIRKNTRAGFRTAIGVPTRTGGNASGTWSINVNGNAAYANNAGNVHIGSRDSTDGNTHYPIFSTSHGDGQNALYTDSNMYYNPANSYLNVNASYAGSAGYANSTAYATNAGYANYSTYTGYPTAGATIQRGQYTWRNSQYSTYSANFVDLVTLTANAFEGNRGHRWLVIGQFNTEQPGSGYDAAEVRINGANVVAASKTWERGVGGTIVSVSSDQTGNWTNLIMQVRRVSSDDILYCNNCSVIAFQQKT